MNQRHRVTDKKSKGETVPHYQQEHRDQHISDWGGEESLLFLNQEHKKSPHAASSLGRRVSCKKMRSRSGRTVVSSERATPRSASAADRRCATPGCCSASTRNRRSGSLELGSMTIERTPGTAAITARTSCSGPATCNRSR